MVGGGDFVVVMRNMGDGTFEAGPNYTVNGTGLTKIVAGDLDGDGVQDVTGNLIDASDTVLTGILWGDGAGGFLDGGTVDLGDDQTLMNDGVPRVAVADLDGDGVDDLLKTKPAAGRLYVGLGDGQRGFTVLPPLGLGFSFSDVAVADVDEDGRLDVTVVDGAATRYHVLLGRGDGTFDVGPSGSLGSDVDKGYFLSSDRVGIGDLDGDGRSDLVVGGVGRLDLLAVPAFADPAPFPPAAVSLGTVQMALVLDDVDADGATDAVVLGLAKGFDNNVIVAYNTP